MKRIEVSIFAILALLSLLLGIALVQEKQATRNLKIKWEFIMSEVYITVNAVDFKTKKPINSNRIWQLKKCYTLFAVITDGYTEHIIETKYIKSKSRSN